MLASRLWLTAALLPLSAMPAAAGAFSSNVSSAEELEYGAVLFEYFQHDYFHALVEQKYAESLKNRSSLSNTGQLVKGGMMVSYGLPDKAEPVFDELLAGSVSHDVSNRAWFYLAKLHYNKGDFASAREAVDSVKGPIPVDILVDYHYLATLVTGHPERLAEKVSMIETAAKDSPAFPYFLFNLAVSQVGRGEISAAVHNLERVTQSGAEEGSATAALVDRARHGLAELAMKSDRLSAAWGYLSQIRTTGLYSNRALLSYAWAAINREQFTEAIPALELLAERSIAIPEVQEAKVLLAHVYEEQGLFKRALARNIQAENEFGEGVSLIAQARRVIDGQDVPREFINNLEAIMDDTDWYARRPSVDYQKLTPFLIDLMASNAFNETLTELADLYVIEDNLHYWADQAEQHQAILKAAEEKQFDQSMRDMLGRTDVIGRQLSDRWEELELYTLVVDEEERERLTALMETTRSDLTALNHRLGRLRAVEHPYEQPDHYQPMVRDHHQRIDALMVRTENQILALEQVMRRLIKLELDKHEERMNYYAAQSRLAKARLYDMALLSLEQSAPATGAMNSPEAQ